MNIEIADILYLLRDDMTHLYILDKSKNRVLYDGVCKRFFNRKMIHDVVKCIDVGENEHGPYIYLEV